MPEVEIEVDEVLVRRLLAGLPLRWRHLADGPVERVATGWDNAVWRVGHPDSAHDGYAVRIPVRAAAAPLIHTAAQWVAEVSAPVRAVGLRAPVPVHVADPGDLLPWPWFLVDWVPGVPLTSVPVSRRDAVADAIATAMPLLHRPAAPQAPVSRARGVPLAARRPLTERHLPEARTHLGPATVDTVLDIIAGATAVPAWPHAPVWCHGDLHAANLTLDTTADPAVLGLLDFDDLTSGDPAVDLRVLWLVLDAAQRDGARATLEASGAYDTHVWDRARGWAASSFVLPIAADRQGRAGFADDLDFALEQLGIR